MDWLWDNWGMLLALAVCTAILIGVFSRRDNARRTDKRTR